MAEPISVAPSLTMSAGGMKDLPRAIYDGPFSFVMRRSEEVVVFVITAGDMALHGNNEDFRNAREWEELCRARGAVDEMRERGVRSLYCVACPEDWLSGLESISYRIGSTFSKMGNPGYGRSDNEFDGSFQAQYRRMSKEKKRRGRLHNDAWTHASALGFQGDGRWVWDFASTYRSTGQGSPAFVSALGGVVPDMLAPATTLPTHR